MIKRVISLRYQDVTHRVERLLSSQRKFFEPIEQYGRQPAVNRVRDIWRHAPESTEFDQVLRVSEDPRRAVMS
ncbi:hypothetical protein A0H81_00493 [Grifola frondosa]|uniref:Uncharacterized protein n=1 Tax=Grifola frondosa TaxID=5627 RepID=A0A1C7MQ91_GRIFR|nr:hypothetical protein A0H81_00493 [Grifola frondosa]